jgi:hypothetical protein
MSSVELKLLLAQVLLRISKDDPTVKNFFSGKVSTLPAEAGAILTQLLDAPQANAISLNPVIPDAACPAAFAQLH